MTSDVIAKMINEDNIQILINLNGYTKVYFIWSLLLAIIFFLMQFIVVEYVDTVNVAMINTQATSTVILVWLTLMALELCRGQEMKYLLCSLHLFRFHIWGSLEPLGPIILITWSPMRYGLSHFCHRLPDFLFIVIASKMLSLFSVCLTFTLLTYLLWEACSSSTLLLCEWL